MGSSSSTEPKIPRGILRLHIAFTSWGTKDSSAWLSALKDLLVSREAILDAVRSSDLFSFGLKLELTTLLSTSEIEAATRFCSIDVVLAEDTVLSKWRTKDASSCSCQ